MRVDASFCSRTNRLCPYPTPGEVVGGGAWRCAPHGATGATECTPTHAAPPPIVGSIWPGVRGGRKIGEGGMGGVYEARQLKSRGWR